MGFCFNGPLLGPRLAFWKGSGLAPQGGGAEPHSCSALCRARVHVLCSTAYEARVLRLDIYFL